MGQTDVRLEDFLREVAYGEVRFKVVGGKLFVIPKQVIERPMKVGMQVHMIIAEPIRLKQS